VVVTESLALVEAGCLFGCGVAFAAAAAVAVPAKVTKRLGSDATHGNARDGMPFDTIAGIACG
jgi:hypothetical protein